jgi:hypothetical protein
LYLPSSYQEAQSIKIPFKGCPQCGRHIVFISAVAVVTRRFLQDFQNTVFGGPEKKIIYTFKN